MFKLRYGYLLMGITTGLILLVSFIWSLPDGKLHIYFCNVGQGDGAYIKFPDGRDMIVDGGPDNSILLCLGKYMPFWDRHIDIALLTHPQKDHMQGFLSVFDRYTIGYFVKSDVDNATQGYQRLEQIVGEKHIPTKYMVAGDRITIGKSTLHFYWPSSAQIAQGKLSSHPGSAAPSVLGTSTYQAPKEDLNAFCLVFELHYNTFDVLFTGDADSRVEPKYQGDPLADNKVEVLKVPHHGSKTGMTTEFVSWVHPLASVISVGKNSYGHPTKEALDLLAGSGSRVLRTDKEGDIQVVSDGIGWTVKTAPPAVK